MTEKEKIETLLQELLKEFEIPESRKIFNKDNLHWLVRNLGMNQHTHPKFGITMLQINKLLKIIKDE